MKIMIGAGIKIYKKWDKGLKWHLGQFVSSYKTYKNRAEYEADLKRLDKLEQEKALTDNTI